MKSGEEFVLEDTFEERMHMLSTQAMLAQIMEHNLLTSIAVRRNQKTTQRKERS